MTTTLESVYRLLGSHDFDQIEPGLFLGSLETFEHANFMKSIDAVVSITQMPAEDIGIPRHIIEHLDLCLPDEENADIAQYFDKAHAFIARHLTEGHRVLVHCRAGISRSATLVAAHLMIEQRLTVLQALGRIKEKRCDIYPNKGFLLQLIELEKRIFANLANPKDLQ
jgi:dual specificity phosphatase 12